MAIRTIRRAALPLCLVSVCTVYAQCEPASLEPPEEWRFGEFGGSIAVVAKAGLISGGPATW